ncbi:MAG: hypothetical protein D6735_06390, partial [Acidobacteria bacterium]
MNYFLVIAFVINMACSSSTGLSTIVSENTALHKQERNKGQERSLKVIQIKPDSPADTVRKFYKLLREKRFRDALMLTNLRPAVEDLTEKELEDFKEDFEAISAQVPDELQISGEIVSNNEATVTLKIPDEDTKALEDKLIKLRKEKESWIILMVDEEAETEVKKEGKNYFYQLKIQTHENEAQLMLQRIAKAQIVYALQNAGQFTDIKTLVQQNLLPDDILETKSTGYRYKVVLSPDKKSYYATAEPAIYGKTGRLSFLMQVDGVDKQARVQSKDNKGEPLKK